MLALRNITQETWKLYARPVDLDPQCTRDGELFIYLTIHLFKLSEYFMPCVMLSFLLPFRHTNLSTFFMLRTCEEE